MHRFVNLKKVAGSNVSLRGGTSDVYCMRTCSLCNRVFAHTPFIGKDGFSRLRSSWANPERVTYLVSRKKKYKIASSHVDESSFKFKRKTKITVLDSIKSEENLNPNTFITSSPLSPAFAGSRLANAGVTIILPSNSSRKMANTLSHLAKSRRSSDHPSNHIDHTYPQEAARLSNVADLIFTALCRNRHLVQDFPLHYPEKQGLEVLSPEPSSTYLDTKEKIEIINEENEELNERTKKKGKRKEGSGIETEQFSDGSKPNKLMTKKQQSSNKQKSKAEMKLADNTLLRINMIRLKRLESRASLVDVWVHTGKINKALKLASSGFKYNDGVPGRGIILEPIICHAFKNFDVEMMLYVVSLSNHHKFTWSRNSYIFCFDYLGQLRNPEARYTDVAKILLENMKKDGITVQDLIGECKNRPVHISNVLRGLRFVDPENVAPTSSVSSYTRDLLLPLNDTSGRKAPYYYSPAKGLMTQDCAENLVDEQIKIHKSPSYKLKNIACTLSASEVSKLLEEQKIVESAWRDSISEGVKSGLKNLSRDRPTELLHAFLSCLPIETYVDVIIQEVYARIEDSDKQSVGFVYAQRLLGKRVKDYYDLAVLQKNGIVSKARQAHVEYCKQYSSPEMYPEGPSNPREIWTRVAHDLSYDDTLSSRLLRNWTADMHLKIGIFLYDILLNDVKVNENIGTDNKTPHMVPALYVLYRKTKKGYQKQLKLHPAVHHIFPTRNQPLLHMHPFELPMVCPPRPWVSATDGVYPLSAPDFQRAPETNIGEDAMMENIQSVPSHELYPCLDSLNQLGSVPWKINNPVLDIVTEVFNSGGMKRLDIPSPPDAAQEEPPLPSNLSLKERMAICKKRSIVRQENAAMYSLWCDTLYKLCIAHEFRDRLFWLPHNMDFRGRVYPVCPHLQHMSNDMARSLLTFARGEKLGPHGFDWLKLHTINLVGNMSKDSLAARLAFANEVMPKILDSAENPLTGERWWMESEYPWQTLAACMEIAKALASGDPENFVSHFPVHQDGSCNGLQHYAALGRDALGAHSVNLIDTEKPSDVYQCVANSVEQHRANDATAGDALAKSLEGFVLRKVVKQTVMTTVYGVTKYGAQMQIRGQLKDLNFPAEDIPKAALYLTNLVFKSLGEMFTSSRNIQDWLTQCSDGIAKGKGLPVRWITPLGLPVMQPYFKKLRLNKGLKTLSKEEFINPTLHRVPINQKHRNAFSPNFIHSLDSCHMILTGLFCEQANVTFVSVHDCYWVHAKNVEAMSKAVEKNVKNRCWQEEQFWKIALDTNSVAALICREQFVALHSKPILEDLSKFLISNYGDVPCASNKDELVDEVENRRIQRVFQSVPPKGNFDLGEVLKSKYFFS